MVVDHIDQSAYDIMDLHLQVLKNILIQTPFEHIEEIYKKEMKACNYLEIIKRSGHLSFDDDDVLIGAYPVSPKKTAYQIEIEGIGSGYSMCAIDAMGLPFTFMKKSKIMAIDKSTNLKIKIEIDPHMDYHKELDLFVTYKETPEEFQGSLSAAIVQCPTINFYSSTKNIDSKLQIWKFQKALKYSQMRFGRREMISRIQKALNDFSKIN